MSIFVCMRGVMMTTTTTMFVCTRKCAHAHVSECLCSNKRKHLEQKLKDNDYSAQLGDRLALCRRRMFIRFIEIPIIMTAQMFHLASFPYIYIYYCLALIERATRLGSLPTVARHKRLASSKQARFLRLGGSAPCGHRTLFFLSFSFTVCFHCAARDTHSAETFFIIIIIIILTE